MLSQPCPSLALVWLVLTLAEFYIRRAGPTPQGRATPRLEKEVLTPHHRYAPYLGSTTLELTLLLGLQVSQPSGCENRKVDFPIICPLQQLGERTLCLTIVVGPGDMNEGDLDLRA